MPVPTSPELPAVPKERILLRIRAEIAKKVAAPPTSAENPDDSFHRFFTSPAEFTCGNCINNQCGYCTEKGTFVQDENAPFCPYYVYNWRF